MILTSTFVLEPSDAPDSNSSKIELSSVPPSERLSCVFDPIELGAGSGGEYDAVHTWILSAEDGSVFSRIEELPLLKHIGRAYAYGLIADLYPVLTQYRYTMLEEN